MLEFLIKVFLAYSTIKFVFHWIVEGHSIKNIWRAMNKTGSTLSYKVKQKDK